MNFEEYATIEMKKRGWTFETLQQKLREQCKAVPDSLDTTNISLQNNIRSVFNAYPDVILRAERDGISFNRPVSVIRRGA